MRRSEMFHATAVPLDTSRYPPAQRQQAPEPLLSPGANPYYQARGGGEGEAGDADVGERLELQCEAAASLAGPALAY